MYEEEDLVTISAVEHYSYCPRQCALIYLESIFDENVFTLRGRREHERVDRVDWETRADARVERALPLWCDRLGLYGRADVVEFRADGAIYPVEYKHGARRERDHDNLQVCAQAACLAEMFSRPVEVGAIYYVASRRRREVWFTAELNARMEATVQAVREMLRVATMPPPANDARCPNCSLNGACVPELVDAARARTSGRLYSVADLEREEA